MTVGRMQITLDEHGGARKHSSRLLLVGLDRCPVTDFEQVCGAAQAALRISRVVSVMWYVLTVSQVGALARFE